MKPSYRFFSVLPILVFIFACQSNSTEKNTEKANLFPYQIDLETAEREKGVVALSEFAKSVTYIPLETNEASLIGRNSYVYLTEEHILTTAFRQIYLFDRSTGHFIREVGKYGQGPDEYRNTYPWLHFNDQEQVAYVRSNSKKTWGLDMNGSKRLELEAPMDDHTLVNGFSRLDQDLYVGFHSNYDCQQTDKLIVFNGKGEVLNTFTNHLTCVNTAPGSISFNSTEGSFHNWSGQVYFKETFNDTLFQVTQNTLEVQAIFNSGEYTIQYQDKISTAFDNNADPYFKVSRIDQTRNYIFFRLKYKGESYSAYYDKNTRLTKVAEQPEAKNHGFTNDLDGFLPFRASYATEGGKLVSHVEAPDVLEWFEDNPEKATRLPAHLKRFENIKQDDNPIVMIVSLKD